MLLTQLEYIIKIVECGSINRAAEKLNVSQSNLTKCIKSLEEELNIIIFERDNKEIELTLNGRKVYYYAKSIADRTRYIMALGKNKSSKTSIFHIASGQNLICTEVLAMLYKEFESENIELQILENNIDTVLWDVQRFNAEIGLVSYNSVQKKQFHKELKTRELEFHILSQSRTFVALGSNNPYYLSEEVSIKSLHKFPIIKGIDDEYAISRIGYEIDNVNYNNFKRTITINTIGNILNFIRRTDAFKIVGDWNRKSYKEASINLIPIKQNDVQMYWGWIKRKKGTLTREATRMIELLETLEL